MKKLLAMTVLSLTSQMVNAAPLCEISQELFGRGLVKYSVRELDSKKVLGVSFSKSIAEMKLANFIDQGLCADPGTADLQPQSPNYMCDIKFNPRAVKAKRYELWFCATDVYVSNGGECPLHNTDASGNSIMVANASITNKYFASLEDATKYLDNGGKNAWRCEY